MTTESKPYHKYRSIQEERILAAAEKLFVENGINSVSIDAIAQEAKITRKTFYQYFQNKQEIALAIFRKFQTIRTSEFESNTIPNGSGFDRLAAVVMDLSTMLENHPDTMRFMVEFDTLFSHEYHSDEVDQVYRIANSSLIPLIKAGVEDGSIRSDIEPETLALTILNLISALNSRFSLLGDHTGAIYGKSAKELLKDTCAIFLRGIQGEQCQSK